MKKDRQKGIRGEASSHQSRATDPPPQTAFSAVTIETIDQWLHKVSREVF